MRWRRRRGCARPSSQVTQTRLQPRLQQEEGGTLQEGCAHPTTQTTPQTTPRTTPRTYHALYPVLGCNAVSISFHEIPYMLVGGEEKKLEKTWGRKLGREPASRQLAIGDQDREFPTVQVTRGVGVGQARPPEPDRPPRRAAPRSVLPRDAATLPGRELPAHGPNGCPAPSAVYPEIVGPSRP